MTLEQLQGELARLYMAAGEKSRCASEHAKAGRYPQAYRCEVEAMADVRAAVALWKPILNVIVGGVSDAHRSV